MQADTGPSGGDNSHEFIILAETGESEVYCHRDFLEFDVLATDSDNDADLQPVVDRWTQLYAATDEKHDPVRFEKEVPEEKRVSSRGIEVGHIFFFGDKYSKPMGALVSTSGGQARPEVRRAGKGCVSQVNSWGWR